MARIDLPSGVITSKSIKIIASEDFGSLEIVTPVSLFASDAKRAQRSLSKAVSIHADDHPKTSGCHGYFEGLRAKDSDAIFLKSRITLPSQAKKNVEKKKFLKDFGAHAVEVNLVSNKASNCADAKHSVGDFSDNDE